MESQVDSREHHRTLNLSRILAVLCLLTSTIAPLSARSLIDQAYESGAITLETARLYRVYEAVNPVALPAQYRN